MAAAAYADMRAASVTSKMEAGWIYTIFATHVTSNYDSYIGLQSFKASSKIFFLLFARILRILRIQEHFAMPGMAF